MTTTSIAYKRLGRSHSDEGTIFARALSLIELKERVFSIALVAGIVVSLAGYIGALYMTFGFGTRIGKQEQGITALVYDISERELELQEKRSRIPEDHEILFSSMEPITSIRYIGGGGEHSASLPLSAP
ncbi:MAG: hypothetical protein A2847_02805 [Candidatus Sungbacteria bacterium RIFCSPHIGHO2_01_FULL_50_25]|uniref:Uncharacterized protein n=1 Tax=Candidatus Sungbacteria bacterium RIFCSPHIGHO2_01_FULL_50_25 TaxID=1802265 RepID=A0A1G2K702_9BACT|nr:MAG: hypothetical protein A2847_02805 [Candidatus Sungbacteria bacterium RIFCSPHIGHO2_01_FULL_50_25]